MEKIALKAQKREQSDKNDLLRKKNLILGVVYGHGVKNQNIAIDYNAFNKAFASAGYSSLVELSIGDQAKVNCIIAEVQTDPISGRYIHADFQQIRKDEKIKVEVILKFIGESKAVKEAGAVLVKNIDAVDIECLPDDLIHEIDVDLSSLQNVGDVIRVGDLKVGKGVKILENSEEIIVIASLIEEEKEIEAKPVEDVSAIKVVGKEKKEEEAEEKAQEKK